MNPIRVARRHHLNLQTMQRPVDDPPTRVVKATLQWFCTRCGLASLGTPQEYDEWRKTHDCDPTIKPIED